MPPAPTFVKLCAEAGVTLPTVKAERTAFLVNSGVIFSDAINVRELAELVATLAWAQHSLASNDDPDSWPITLPESLLGRLLSLYPIPPQRASPGPPASDASRMAAAIAFYAPSPPQQGPPPAAPQAPLQGQLINTARADAAPGIPPPVSVSAGPPAPPPPAKLPGKRLMHEELSRSLPAVVYHAFDVSSHLTADKRSKLLAACKTNDPSVLLDGTNSAAFGHHFSLVLTDGDHFDAARRGLALAAAGRSAAITADAVGSSLDASRRNSLHQEFRDQWKLIAAALPLHTELSGTMVNQLWSAVTYVMTIRADRSATYGIPEIEADCRRQLAELGPYRSAIAVAVARTTDYSDHVSGPHPINVAYLHLFLPFWWEHVLLRPRLVDAAAAADQANKILKASPASAPACPTAAASPPAPLAPTPPPPPPAYYPPLAFGPPAFPPFPGPFSGYPPVPTPWTPGTTPQAPPSSRGPGTPPSCCKPLSPVIVGTTLGVIPSKLGRSCDCVISRTYPGKPHRTFECPIRMHRDHHTCPGWTAAGVRIPSSWAGDDITPACRKEWAAFAPTLPTSWAAAGVDIAF
jgi:hypothetical protein